MNRALIYIRVSTQDQVENHSLDTQRKRCVEFCQQRGLEILEVFSEEGESAKTADRTELRRMLDYCAKHARKNGVTHVVIYKFDRLSRRAPDMVQIHELLGSFGVAVQSVMEPVDDSPIGNWVRFMMAANAQLDNDLRAQRTREGMLTALQKGRWLWKAPVGYRKPPADEAGPSLVPDPVTAPLVQTAFELMAAGADTRAAVRRQVTAMGLLGAQGRPLTADRFNAMLSNPIYCGRVRSARFNFEGPGDFQSLVSEDVFARAQIAMNPALSHPVRHRYDNPDFPLRRILSCPDCNGPLTGSWSRGRNGSRYGYYHCPKGSCRGTHRKAAVEEAFITFLAQQSVPGGIADLLAEAIRDTWETRAKTVDTAVQRLQAQLRQQEVRREQLVDALVHRAVIDKETFDARNAQVQERMDALRLELAAQSSDTLDLERCLDFGRTLLRDLPDCWNRLHSSQRAGFLKALFPAGLQYDGSEVGTAQTPWHNWGLRQSALALSGEVPPTVTDWNRVEQWLWDVDRLRQIVAITSGASPYGVVERGSQPELRLRHRIGKAD